jgi:glycosyltransferase involved in cell wall biosynthesis
MEIVILAHFAGSLHHGMVYGHYYLAREWVRIGHKVTIVAASYAHTRFKQPQNSKHLTEEDIEGIRYVWVPTPIYSSSSRLGRVLNIIFFSLRAWLANFIIKNADIVICSSHHPFPIYCAKHMAKRFKAKLVFEVRDLWPLTLIELGGATLHNPFIRIMQWAEDFAYRHADHVISVLPMAQDYMVAHGMAPEKFNYIPNGIDFDGFGETEPLPPEYIAKLEEARYKKKFIVGYAGRVGLANSIDTLLCAISKCKDHNVCVAILGDGSHLERLRFQAKQLCLVDRVLFFEPVKKSQVADFLSRIDVGYIGLQKQPLFRFGISPTKLNDYMLAAKPVIAAISAPDDVITSSGCGVICPSEDEIKLSEAILSLKSIGAEKRAKMGKRGRRWIQANRDYRILAKRFLDIVIQ